MVLSSKHHLPMLFPAKDSLNVWLGYGHYLREAVVIVIPTQKACQEICSSPGFLRSVA